MSEQILSLGDLAFFIAAVNCNGELGACIASASASGRTPASMDSTARVEGNPQRDRRATSPRAMRRQPRYPSPHSRPVCPARTVLDLSTAATSQSRQQLQAADGFGACLGTGAMRASHSFAVPDLADSKRRKAFHRCAQHFEPDSRPQRNTVSLRSPAPSAFIHIRTVSFLQLSESFHDGLRNFRWVSLTPPRYN